MDILNIWAIWELFWDFIGFIFLGVIIGAFFYGLFKYLFRR